MLPFYRIVLIIVVLGLILAGRAVFNWINVRSDLGIGGWPFIL